MALTRQQLAELKRIMQQRSVALAGEIHGRTHDATLPPEKGGIDRAENAVSGQIADLAEAEIRRDIQELGELEAALGRLSTGAYGRCVDCHLDIAFDRLRAQPGAIRCLVCQMRHDRSDGQADMRKL